MHLDICHKIALLNLRFYSLKYSNSILLTFSFIKRTHLKANSINGLITQRCHEKSVSNCGLINQRSSCIIEYDRFMVI